MILPTGRSLLAGPRPATAQLYICNTTVRRGATKRQPLAPRFLDVTTRVIQAAASTEADEGTAAEHHSLVEQPPWLKDEYESPYDVGYVREYVDDQYTFITEELELTEDQQTYLLVKLGLIEFKEDDEPTSSKDSDDDSDIEPQASAAAPQQEETVSASQNGVWRGQHDASSQTATSANLIQTHLSDDRSLSPGDFSINVAPSISFDVARATSSSQASTTGPSATQPKGILRAAYNPQQLDSDYDVINLRVIGRRSSTAAAMGQETDLTPGTIIAGRYQVLEQVGEAAFSRAVQVLDLKDDRLLCLKVVKNDKESMDACLEEIRLLQLVNARDPDDRHGLIRMHDYFYHLGHLFLVMELLGGNLYDTQRQDPTYFTPARIQAIARQTLLSLDFLHCQDIIHADIKPENILVKDYRKCSVKLIDLGCSIYSHETHNTHYVQSRSYRAPEVMLGLPYDGRIDVWSLGCVLAELVTGQVLFPAAADVITADHEVHSEQISEAAMLARMTGMLGPFPEWMLQEGSSAGAFFTRSRSVYERCNETGYFQVLTPKITSLAARVPDSDRYMLHFLQSLLSPDPTKRPTVDQALRHPWLQHKYR